MTGQGVPAGGWPRRRLLRSMGLAALATGAVPLLAACGGAAAVTTGGASSAGATGAVTSAATSSTPASVGAATTGSAAATSSGATTAAGSTGASAAASGTAPSAAVTSSTVASASATGGTAAGAAAGTSASGSAAASSAGGASGAAGALGRGEFHGGTTYQAPPTGHWNPFVTNAISISIYNDLVNPPFAKYYWAQNKWLNLLATDFSLQPPDRFVVTLRGGVKWSDGKDVTPQDVLTTFGLARLMSSPVWQYLDQVSASGNTITFHMAKPASVVQRYVLEQNIYADAVFGTWAQKAGALFGAGKKIDDPEVKALLADFQKFRPAGSVASGPFMFDQQSVGAAQLTLVKHPAGLMAAQVLFAKVLVYNGETPTITPLVLAKQVDYATHGFPPATVQAFQQEGLRILRPPSFSGAALYINYAKLKGLARPEVRQALAYLTDRVQNATVSLGQSALPQKYMTGMSDNLVPQWIDQADVAKLNQYATDAARATGLLQGLGWKKGPDGTWTDATGAAWNYDLLVPSDYADWSAAAQNLAEQLTKFGLKTVVRGVEHNQANQAALKGDFNLAIQGWGAGSPYPQFSYQTDILANVPPQDALGTGIAFALQQTTKSAGAVNFSDLVTAAGEGLDQGAQKAAVTKLALAFNEVLPIIPVWEKYGNNPVLEGVRVTGWPPDSDPIYKNSYYSDSFTVMMLYTGQLKPV